MCILFLFLCKSLQFEDNPQQELEFESEADGFNFARITLNYNHFVHLKKQQIECFRYSDNPLNML